MNIDIYIILYINFVVVFFILILDNLSIKNNKIF